MKFTDTEHYFNMLMSLSGGLHHLREVATDHADCPGCKLCLDCQGVEYTLKIYYDRFLRRAPRKAVAEYRRELEPDPD